MTKVALKGLLGARPGRSSPSLAIVLGVAMISGHVRPHGHDPEVVRQRLRRRLRPDRRRPSAARRSSSNSRNRRARPGTRCWPRSARCRRQTAGGLGRRRRRGQARRRHGKTIGGENAEGEGFGVDPGQARFSPLTLAAGPLGRGPRRDRHRLQHRRPSTTTRSATRSARRPRVRCASTRSRASASSAAPALGGLVTLAAFDLPPRRTSSTRRGRSTGSRWPRPRASRRTSSPARSGRWSDRRCRSRPATRRSRRPPTTSARASASIRVFLLAFGGISLFVGAFVIFNTISITVAQRTRELATLRTLGASRRQVLRSVLLETAVIGVRRLGDRPGAGHRHRHGAEGALLGARPRPAGGECGRGHAHGRSSRWSSARW